MNLYRLHAIFSSLQGEGRNAGMPATFIRFSSCNLACTWCDTHKSEKMRLVLGDIVKQVGEFGNRCVIVTGGEPTIQPGLDELLIALRDAGHWLALETNGVIAPSRPELFDYIAVSPKNGYAARYTEKSLHAADEVRIVAVSSDIAQFCTKMREKISATDYYISPLEEHGKMHYRRAMQLVLKLNKLSPDLAPPWKLSLQQHKILGIR